MIYVFKSGSIVYDGSTLSEEEKNEAILVVEEPYKKDVEGKYAVLKWDIETQTAWYEYEDIPKTPVEEQQEKTEALEQSIAELTAVMAMFMTP